MKYKVKTIAGIFWILTVFLWAGGITAFGADEKIDTVKLSFSCDPKPEHGGEPGSVTANGGNKEYTVESAEYTNDVEVWTMGDEPRVKVILNAESGYRFSYTTSSHFRLSGSGAKFRRAKVYDGGDTLELEVSLNQVDGRPEQLQELEWSNSYAMWEESDVAKEYEVRLYRNKSLVTTVTTTNTVYDFRNHITREGDYTFRVRAIASYESKAGEWSDYSEENSFSENQAVNYNSGTWIQTQYGWWYRYYNGDYPVNCWKMINGIWYYFNGDGYSLNGWQWMNGVWYYLNGSGAMLTGWQYINGVWYYLNGSGAMLTGWQYINGSWYYLNGSGVMLTGWQYINGSWYYLDGSGAMYANRTTPDGYYVDGNGVWR